MFGDNFIASFRLERILPTEPSLAIPFLNKFSFAPITEPTVLPSFKKKNDGMAQTPNIDFIVGTLSTSTFTNTTSFVVCEFSRANASNTGAICLHGGHLIFRKKI